MSPTVELCFFIPLALALLLFAGAVVVAKSPVHAAMCLVGAFFCLAGVYVILVAHLIAFMQILVYAGAVMVLFLFVIMLISLGDEQLVKERYRGVQLVGVLGVVALVAALSWVFMGIDQTANTHLDPGFGTVRTVGKLLYTQYLLPFEATSLLLLAAIVGAVVVAKERI
jgi:NADH-quinone oxidoreductase subunit J